MDSNLKNGKCSQDSLIFISALCLFLSAVEYAIPKPLPFLRLGLANLPVIVFLKQFRFRDLLFLLVFKVLGQALISGTLFSYIFVFSVSGSFSSGLVMFAFYKILYRHGFISNVGLSLLGAMANCCAQLVCSYFIMFGENTVFIAPMMIIFSAVTGILLGLFCNQFEKKSRWLAQFDIKSVNSIQNDAIPGENERKTSKNVAIISVIIAIIAVLLLLIIRNVVCTWAIVLLFFVLLETIKKGHVKLRPPLLTAGCIILFSLFSPYGLVLADLGFMKITAGALESGLRKSGVLLGMTFCSQFVLAGKFSFPGKIGGKIQKFFGCYGMITQSMQKIQFRGIIQFIDEHLMGITGGMETGGTK